MEVISPIISAIITTVLAFCQVFLFLDGRIGEFFGEVSVIVILTLSISLIEALIILPARISPIPRLWFGKSEEDKKKGIAKLFRQIIWTPYRV